MNMNTANTAANTNTTSISKEAARMVAFWIATGAEVQYLAPGTGVEMVLSGEQHFGSGGYTARTGIIGKHELARLPRQTGPFVSLLKGRVTGAAGAVAETVEADCVNFNGRRATRRVAWIEVPPVPPRPEGGEGWPEYYDACYARDAVVLAIPEVRAAFRRAAGPEVARTLDARLRAAKAAGYEEGDALRDAPVAERILARMRKSVRERPEYDNTPFQKLARELLG